MAVTSIWYVSERVDSVIKYIENPEKTIERPELSPEAVAARQAVGDVIDYAENGDKTEQMMYVTGINCSAQNAANDRQNCHGARPEAELLITVINPSKRATVRSPLSKLMKSE